ncbi:MAG: LysR family transcriptional regulator, partial [Mycobacteriaceae bacterium]|nr:LysR family transcriptional regulator [Mycobacteriaceae bacterium]
MAFKDIEILLTLAEELHFGRTARRLHLSQARISQSIKTQERRFGAALVDRSSYRNMQLTALGEQLVADLRPAYQRIVDALDSAQRAAQGVRGTIRVGFVSAMASEDIARIIAGFTRRRPGWTVSMRQVQPCDPAAVLASGSVDVALLRVPFPKQRQFSSMPLLTEERWVMLPERHKLA